MDNHTGTFEQLFDIRKNSRLSNAYDQANRPPPSPESILDEAKRVIQDRRAAYDEREQNFTRIATIWSVVFGHEVTPEQVAMCMIGMKLAREVYKPSRDNRVDICGYADCLEELVNAHPA